MRRSKNKEDGEMGEADQSQKKDAKDKIPLTKEEQDKKLQISHEQDQESKEKEEDKRNKKAEEKQSRTESQKAFEEEDDNMAKTVTVTFKSKDLSLADLKCHFQQYGKVVDVFLAAPDKNFATVQFQSGALARWLVGMERHTLQRKKKNGGPVALQLQGWAARLPGGSGRGNARRRPSVQQQNLTNPLRFFMRILNVQ